MSVTGRRNPWAVKEVDPAVLERIAAGHTPDPVAVRMGVDIVGDPQREDDEGFNWTRSRCARNVADVVPGSTVVLGSSIGRRGLSAPGDAITSLSAAGPPLTLGGTSVAAPFVTGTIALPRTPRGLVRQ